MMSPAAPNDQRPKRSRQKTNRFKPESPTGNASSHCSNLNRRISDKPPPSKRSKQEDAAAADEQKGCRVAQDFWEVEKILGRRVNKKQVEFLIRWKGCTEDENSWEPASSLCDTAYKDAMRFAQQEKKRQEQLKENEWKLGVEDAVKESSNGKSKDAAIVDRTPAPLLPTIDAHVKMLETAQEGPWSWTDEEQVKFQDVDRIHVNDSDAAKRVTEARMNGIPVVIVGHVGWANFAKRWLKPATTNDDSTANDNECLLDLSKPHELDITQMIDDIGAESVPVVRHNYNEENPIDATISASTFLKKCWPVDARFYLHQWQFPLSDTAGRKLCHQNTPLPNSIMGDDLLKYWLDLPQCKSDSALQYLFMGRDGTRSKLHRDNGGLAISIAPIVGEKECILVHRSDGASCLYHLDAPLDSIDLDTYPLLAHARVWKTTVCPGEILLMPHGTYHQCRNVTPCLSYSRFHLDKVNLLPFLQSMLNDDAPDIEHSLIIWNAASAYIKKVDTYTEQAKEISESIVETVDMLRALRNICKEIARRIHQWHRTKRSNGTHPTYQEVLELYQNLKSSSQSSDLVLDEEGSAGGEPPWWEQVHHWDIIVNDIDSCLHEFRYRHRAKAPKCALPKQTMRGTKLAEEVRCNDVLERNFENLRNCLPTEGRIPNSIAIKAGDTVAIRWHGKQIGGTVLQVEQEMYAAFLSFDGYTELYDEFYPWERLRVRVCGEGLEEIRLEDIKPDLHVVQLGEKADEYPAVVRSTTHGTFYLIELSIGHYYLKRWLPREYILHVNHDCRGPDLQETQMDTTMVALSSHSLSGSDTILESPVEESTDVALHALQDMEQDKVAYPIFTRTKATSLEQPSQQQESGSKSNMGEALVSSLPLNMEPLSRGGLVESNTETPPPPPPPPPAAVRESPNNTGTMVYGMTLNADEAETGTLSLHFEDPPHEQVKSTAATEDGMLFKEKMTPMLPTAETVPPKNDAMTSESNAEGSPAFQVHSTLLCECPSSSTFSPD